MERLPRSSEEADKLLALSDLLRSAALTVKEEWVKEDFLAPASTPAPSQPQSHLAADASKHTTADTARILPSPRLWEAEKTIETVSGALVELTCEPNQRIQQLLTSYFESRALYIVTEREIPDLLTAAEVEAGVDRKEVEVNIKTLTAQTGIESRKLGEYKLAFLLFPHFL